MHITKLLAIFNSYFISIQQAIIVKTRIFISLLFATRIFIPLSSSRYKMDCKCNALSKNNLLTLLSFLFHIHVLLGFFITQAKHGSI
jgi:hypothetical protein